MLLASQLFGLQQIDNFIQSVFVDSNQKGDLQKKKSECHLHSIIMFIDCLYSQIDPLCPFSHEQPYENLYALLKSTDHIFQIINFVGPIFQYIEKIDQQPSKNKNYYLKISETNFKLAIQKALKIFKYILRLLYQLENSTQFYFKEQLIELNFDFAESDQLKTFQMVLSAFSSGFEVEAFVTIDLQLAFLKLIQTAITQKNLYKKITQEVWNYIIQIMIAITDQVIQKKDFQDLIFQACQTLMISLIFSSCQNQKLWKQFKQIAQKWNQSKPFIEIWSATCIGLCKRILSETFNQVLYVQKDAYSFYKQSKNILSIEIKSQQEIKKQKKYQYNIVKYLHIIIDKDLVIFDLLLQAIYLFQQLQNLFDTNIINNENVKTVHHFIVKQIKTQCGNIICKLIDLFQQIGTTSFVNNKNNKFNNITFIDQNLIENIGNTYTIIFIQLY